jgi:hypothetical protein
MSLKSYGRQQPTTAYQINWSNPVTRDLELGINFTSTSVNLLSKGKDRILNPTFSSTLDPTPAVLTTTDQYRSVRLTRGDWYDVGPIVTQPTALSVMFLARSYSADSTFRTMISRGLGGGLSLQLVALSNTTFQSNVVFVNNGTAQYNCSGSVNVINRIFNLITVAQPNSLKQYLNGNLNASNTSFTNSGFRSDASKGWNIGLGSGATPNALYNWDGTIALFASWRRALSEAEIKSLGQNPWQIFIKRKQDPRYALISLPGKRILTLSNGLIRELPVGQENTGKKPIVLLNGNLKERSTTEGTVVLLKDGQLKPYDPTTESLVT